MIKFIFNYCHYSEIIPKVPLVKQTLWIGTADIKDLYIEVGKQKIPFLGLCPTCFYYEII